MHRLREWGTAVKLFDLLDERRLAVAEILTLAKLIFGAAAADLPHPGVDYKAFKVALDACQTAAGPVWDPLRSRSRPYFDLKKLDKLYEKPPFCALM